MKSLAEEFSFWCANIAPGFRNSPDIINLRFWLCTKKQLQVPLTELEERNILAAIRPDYRAIINEQLQQTNEEETDDMATRKRNAKGKPAGPALLKELNLETKQGKIISFIMDLSNSVTDVCKAFDITRHPLMTQLNVVSRTTGIGYSVTGDEITLTMPAGVTYPFEI